MATEQQVTRPAAVQTHRYRTRSANGIVIENGQEVSRGRGGISVRREFPASGEGLTQIEQTVMGGLQQCVDAYATADGEGQ